MVRSADKEKYNQTGSTFTLKEDVIPLENQAHHVIANRSMSGSAQNKMIEFWSVVSTPNPVKSEPAGAVSKNENDLLIENEKLRIRLAKLEEKCALLQTQTQYTQI